MVDVPDATPVTRPVELTVATDGAELLHVPPPTVEDHAALLPAHTEAVPVSTPADGVDTTDTVSVAKPPAGIV
jgi:hypothetical protein